MRPNPYVNMKQSSGCTLCGSRKQCGLRTLDGNEPGKSHQCLNDNVRSRILRRGEVLFESGGQTRVLAFVKSGTFKQSALTVDGCEQIVRFIGAGASIVSPRISESAVSYRTTALETSSVCEISESTLLEAQTPTGTVLRLVLDLLQEDVIDRDEHATMLGQKPAKARLAWLLQKISLQHASRGLDPSEFRLPMSRCEVANYLAMAVETVSRLFGDLERRGVICCDGRWVRVCCPDQLAEISGLNMSPAVLAKAVG